MLNFGFFLATREIFMSFRPIHLMRNHARTRLRGESVLYGAKAHEYINEQPKKAPQISIFGVLPVSL